MKKAAFITTLVLLVCVVSGALALGQRVFDDANLFTKSQKEGLESRIAQIDADYDVDLVVVTTQDTQRKSSRDYADDFFDQGGFGVGSDYSGALLLINMQAREPHLSTSGHMIDILNDRRLEAILDAQYDDLADGNYAQAMSTSLDMIIGYLQAGPVAGQYREAEDKINPFSPMWLMLSVGSGLLIALIAALAIKKSYRREFAAVPYNYSQNTDLALSVSNDTLVGSHIDKQYIPPQSSSGGSGGGGRSTTHTSSSGRSHGGATGRKF